MTSQIKSEVSSLAKVLRLKRFIIPRHQRPYAWKPEHVNWLLDDIADGIAEQKSHHFLGPIMFVSIDNSSELEINDGQQRIATFMLICAYLCRSFRDAGYSQGENQAMRMMFDLDEGHNKTLNDADELQPRITLSTNDHQTYKSLTCGHSIRKNGQMNAAWVAIDDFFSCPEYSSLEVKKTFFNFLLNKLLVAWIKFENSEDSITAFETQNTRGKPLEQIQLTCTYFYSRLRGDEVRSNDVHAYINDIRTQFRGDEAKFFNYVRCFAQCRYGYLSNERFCRDIRKVVNTKDETHEFVRLLSEPTKIEIFQHLTRMRPDANDFEKLTTAARQGNSRRKIVDYLADLNKYKSVSNAVMFSLLCRYWDYAETSEKVEVAKFVYKSSKLLASFFQRAAHSFPGAFSPSKYDQHVAELARDIASGTCKTPEKFLATLRDLDRDKNIIPDSSYKDRMNSIEFPSKIQDAKYILARINEYGQDGLSVVSDKSTTEHILPKSPVHISGWKFTREDHNRYVHRLGNLTLLAPRDNKPQAEHNANFAAKKRIYRQSEYAITKTLRDKSAWNIDAIVRRQRELAKIAAIIWNFDI